MTRKTTAKKSASSKAPPKKAAPKKAAPNKGDKPLPVLLVTGLSGAGKTASLKVLEDLGYEAVDNLPLSLLGNLVKPAAGSSSPLAVGVDIRTRDFAVEPFLAELDELFEDIAYDVRLLFLDCDDVVLLRRFDETRRRHPLAVDRPVAVGIRRERHLVWPLRDRADLVIDTSNFILGDLKRLLSGHYALDRSPGVSTFVTSFSYRRGLPPEADIVFDVRFLSNPHYVPGLRPLTGKDQAVADYVAADEGFEEFFDSVTSMLKSLLPRYDAEGKSYLTIAIGCTGGQHRSVFTAERLAAWLRREGVRVTVSHRELPTVAGGG
jgi:UPF0042 nucleotide-binding protein